MASSLSAKKVNESTVEALVLWDVYNTFAYTLVRRFRGWPCRDKLLKEVLRADMDEDGLNDEAEAGENIEVTALQYMMWMALYMMRLRARGNPRGMALYMMRLRARGDLQAR